MFVFVHRRLQMIVIIVYHGERQRHRYSREHFNEYTMQALNVEKRSSYLGRFDPSNAEW